MLLAWAWDLFGVVCATRFTALMFLFLVPRTPVTFEAVGVHGSASAPGHYASLLRPTVPFFPILRCLAPGIPFLMYS